MASLVTWLILSVMVGVTIIFYQLGIKKKQNDLLRMEQDLLIRVAQLGEDIRDVKISLNKSGG